MFANPEIIKKIEALTHRFGICVEFHNPQTNLYHGVLEFRDVGDCWHVVYVNHGETQFVFYSAYFLKRTGEMVREDDVETVTISRTAVGRNVKKCHFQSALRHYRRNTKLIELTYSARIN